MAATARDISGKALFINQKEHLFPYNFIFLHYVLQTENIIGLTRNF
jgi:hypothetical protein